ncbi:MAG: hypothetical protein Kow0069_06810 [Promethearchaeota archaeon]
MPKYLFKIILAGACGVGKTTLHIKFTEGTFESNTPMTIGVDFAVVHTETKFGPTTLQIWDFGGVERFRVMLPSFCKGAKGCLLLFDLTRTHTFHELPEWIEIIRANNTDDVPVILCGAKADLVANPDDPLPEGITQPDVNAFMEEHGVDDFKYISSKTGLNVREVFIQLAETITERQ